MSTPTPPPTPAKKDESRQATHFIRQIIDRDLAEQRYDVVATRFPPEPNGYLHIGHAKSICLNFGLAESYGGRCHLRFDDTNPTKEEQEYVDSIQSDVRWLGFDWGEHLYFASDYFQQMYDFAVKLIKDGKAYVDSLSKEELREHRGSLTEPGRESPYRSRSVEENLDLFERMRKGEFADGEHVLRAKIDMASPNMLMRDPLLYRIVNASHHRTGDAWCIYPMYDYAHCLEDAIEHISHSICTLEFENNRELYDWVLENVGYTEPRPHQHEFARLNLDYTVMSKRKLLTLVKEGHVSGWDDPRMPTIAGLRRRGYTPEAIRAFADMIGVAKTNSVVDIGKLEYCVRDDLNHRAPRVMAVLNPLKVTLTNYPLDLSEKLDASYWPHDVPKEGSRPVPFARTIYIERDDFAEVPPKGWHRLTVGGEVRLRYGYVIRCYDVVKDAAGEIVELRCSYDPATRGGASPDGRKVKGTIHWVAAPQAVRAEVRLYDRLFTVPAPDAAEGDFKDNLNPESLVVVEALVEPSLGSAQAGAHYQFERQGYFVADIVDHTPERPVFNRVVTLKDSWTRKTAGPAVDAATARREAKAKKDQGRPRPTKLSPAQLRAKAREADPQLAAAFARFQTEHGLSEDDADVLTGDTALAAFYEAAAEGHAPEPVAKWVTNVLLAEVKDRPVSDLPFDGAAFARLIELADAGTVSTPGAKAVLEVMLKDGGEPADIVKARGLEAVTDDGALQRLVDDALAANPDNVARYKEGKTALLGFFVGQVIRASGGSADPTRVKALVKATLDA
ncbi:MAG: glutamine--tRNA ligase/YqeY domain fusion protein [Deltaproteobacteria bacterium]|nr:MAG: glutamine--tRNA ligase/YqeY domain fusion protein [Deltaproteobacteria bacterium]